MEFKKIIIEKGGFSLFDQTVNIQKVHFEPVVPLIWNFQRDRVIGIVTSFLREEVLKANLIITDSTFKEEFVKLLTPAIGGKIDGENIFITEVSLGTNNKDATILPIGKQLETHDPS